MGSETRTFQCFPLHGWLVALAAGWRFGLIVEPMRYHHGHWSVLLEWGGEPDAV